MSLGKVALVTGSGKRRVGWHVAEALARRGWRLVIHYRSSAEDAAETVREMRSLGSEALAVQADLTDENDVRRLVETTLSAFARIDALVNAAGVWRPTRFEDVTAADVRWHFETNTLGTFLCAQHAGLAMVRQQEGGAIVNLGDWAIARPYLDYAAYFPSKGAVEVLTRSLAVELGSRNPRVRVNCVHPGPVMLPDHLTPQARQQAIDSTIVKREGSPENVALAVLHFIDNDFVTGCCMTVDGGRSIHSDDPKSHGGGNEG